MEDKHPHMGKIDDFMSFDDMQCSQQSDEQAKEQGFMTGRWTYDEHVRFLEAMNMYGRDWAKVQSHVQS